jgi:hypothetical protein
VHSGTPSALRFPSIPSGFSTILRYATHTQVSSGCTHLQDPSQYCPHSMLIAGFSATSRYTACAHVLSAGFACAQVLSPFFRSAACTQLHSGCTDLQDLLRFCLCSGSQSFPQVLVLQSGSLRFISSPNAFSQDLFRMCLQATPVLRF